MSNRVAMIVLIKALVETGISPAEISAAVPGMTGRFFRSAQGRLNSEEFVAAVTSNRGRFAASRYFCKNDWLIHFGDRTFALTNQWVGSVAASFINTLLQAFPGRGVDVVPST